MNTTILCNFDDVDLAELAARKLKNKLSGIRHVEVTKPIYGEPRNDTAFIPLAGGFANLNATAGTGIIAPMLPVYYGSKEEKNEQNSDYIPHSVSLRIQCSPEMRSEVEAQLINLGALKIHSYNDLPERGSF